MIFPAVTVLLRHYQELPELNYQILRIFAPLLVVVGILGFVLPAHLSLTSGATPYNIFHILFGLVGLGLVRLRRVGLIRAFNLTFGLIDLYQAVASFVHLFPEEYFLWTRVDDILHIVIGSGLVIVALFGDKR